MTKKLMTTIDNQQEQNYNAKLEKVEAKLDSLCQLFENIFLPNLDNGTAQVQSASWTEGDTDMAKKIRRPYTINGVTCWVSGDTEQEILDNAIKLRMGIAPAMQEQARAKHNFKDYAMNWYEKYSKPNIASVTAETYHRQLKNYLIPALGSKNVEDITLDDVQSIFNGMSGAKATKDKCKEVLNMIFKLAVEEGLMKRNLLNSTSFRLKGAARKDTPPYSIEEMRYIVGHIKELKKPEDRAYIALQALHPLRLEEVLGLKWEDVDRGSMTLHIRRAVTHPTRNQPEVKETKTGEIRDVALTESALYYLDMMPQGEQKEFIIGGKEPVSYTMVRRMCERIAREMHFSGKITPIRFRTTVLTDIYEQTGDIKLTQMAAGHKTPELTLKHYIKGRRGNADSAIAIDRVYNAGNC